MDLSVAEIAELVDGTVVGDGQVRVTGVNGIAEARPGDLSFLVDRRYLRYLHRTRAAALLVPEGVTEAAVPLIRVPDPYQAFAAVIERVRPARAPHPHGVHATAIIGQGVTLGEGVGIGPYVCIADGCTVGNRAVLYAGVCLGHGATVGEDTILYPHVVAREYVRIGARCIIHAGAVLGSDGFGFDPSEGGNRKIPQIGTVVVEDDVEIGANSAVDRATFTETRIGQGTKIDNLVQIGHNVRLGEHCILSGMTGIAGSTRLGNRVVVAAMAGVSGHLQVGDGAIVGAGAGVTKSVPPGRVVSGFPAREHEEEKRVWASTRRLPDALRRVRELEARLSKLEGLLNEQTTNDS